MNFQKWEVFSSLLLPYSHVSNSVLQADWLQTFECDVVMGHYYPGMPARYVTTSFEFETKIGASMLQHRRAAVSKSSTASLQWLHARPTMILALKSYFYFVKTKGLRPALTIG